MSLWYYLTGLNRSSAAGPDNLHLHQLKACSAALSSTFLNYFVRHLEKGVLPSLWKTFIVALLYKNGSSCAPLNYRLMNLISVCCKVLERVIVSQLMDYLELNDLLSIHQYEFRKGRSVEDQLLVTYVEVVELVDNGFTVDIFFIFVRLLMLWIIPSF